MQTIRQAECCLRSVYRAALEKPKSSVVAHFTEDGTFSPPPPAAQRPSNSTPIDAFYSRCSTQTILFSPASCTF